jgi:GLPGLI family protein
MKIASLFTVLLGFTLVTTAQITEAKIAYEINMSSDNPELEMQLSMMQGSTLEMIFSEQKSKQNVSMGGFMTTTTISDSETGETLTLMDGMMGKIAMKMNINDTPEEETEEIDELEFEFVDETKSILGYTCHKAFSVDENGNESTFWYSKEIQAPRTESQYFQKEIPGMPLEFQIVSPEVTMTFTATEFVKKLNKADKDFSMQVPEGYKEMTPEEMQGAFGQ